MRCSDLFTVRDHCPLAPSLSPEAKPWEWLTALKEALRQLAVNPFSPYPSALIPPGCHLEGKVYLHPTVKLPAYATLIGPLVIDANTEIRPGAFLRGNVVIGRNAVIGNACEIKNALLLDHVQVPHFNYVGDSILGEKAHLGAGVILSNLRLDQAPVRLRVEETVYDTGLRKCGAFLGDGAEVGCNGVLQPGTILGREAKVFPLTAFGGYLPAHHLARQRTTTAIIKDPGMNRLSQM